MSRIFDALSKSERDRAGQPGGPVAETLQEPQAWRQVASAAQLDADGLDQSPVLQCGSTNGHRPAAAWHNAGQETFRVLHHRLELIRRRRSLKKLLVTSAIPKEGKTTVAINLAVALARSAQRVLLIDADLRHPGVHRALGFPEQTGLADWLEQRAELNALIRRLEPFGFFYLPSGHATTNPGELLRLQPMQEFLTATAGAFDWVIVDTPPLVPFVDAHHLSTLTDGVLVVLRQGVTPRPAIEQAFASLDRAFVVGAVLNGARDTNHNYYRYYGQEHASRGHLNQTPPAAGRTTGAGGSLNG